MKINPIPEKTPSPQDNVIADTIIWLPVRNRKQVIYEIDGLKASGTRRLQVGIDCMEFNTKKGSKGYDWLIPLLGENFGLELCFDNFPEKSSRSKSPKCLLTEIVEHFVFCHGQHFDSIQLCRQTSHRIKNSEDENIFAEEIVFAATWAKYLGKKVCLGKIQPGDFEWISKLISTRFFANIDSIEIDKEGGDLWSSSTKFYERALRSLFEAKGVNTEIRQIMRTSSDLDLSPSEIAC